MAGIVSFEEFANDWYSMDTYELNEEDKKKCNNAGFNKLFDILREQISKLSDEKIMNYSIMIEMVIAIKMKYSILTDEEKQGMTEYQYLRLSKYVVELHKMRETTICKAFKLLLDEEMDKRQITSKVKDTRLETMTSCFPNPLDMYTYLAKKMNEDEDISLITGTCDENGNIKCVLLPDEELINTMIQEKEEEDEQRDFIIQILAQHYQQLAGIIEGDEDRSDFEM